MKVKELIAFLEAKNPDSDVHIAYNYGDYWRTTVAPEIREIEEGEVEWSEYHRMHRMVEDDSDRDWSLSRSVVIIR